MSKQQASSSKHITDHDRESGSDEWNPSLDPTVPNTIVWSEAAVRIAQRLPDDEREDYLDALTLTVFADPTVDTQRASTLVTALGFARSDLTRRSVALALAISAEADDVGAVDALLAQFRQERAHEFLAPAFLDALTVLALRSPLARAEATTVLLRLTSQDTPDLLVRSAKAIVRLDALRRLNDTSDLRAKLTDWDANPDPMVRAEVATQQAFLLFYDALQSETTADMRLRFAHAQKAFEDAEQLEEHRPDAALFACLLDMMGVCMEFTHYPSQRQAVARAGVVEHLRTLETRLRTLLASQWWPLYRSDVAVVCVTRVLATADALLNGIQRVHQAADWTNFDEALSELAAVYGAIQGVDTVPGLPHPFLRLSGRLADLVFAPTLGPALQQAVGRHRLKRVAENYLAIHGEDRQALGLRAFVRVVTLLEETTENMENPAEAPKIALPTQTTHTIGDDRLPAPVTTHEPAEEPTRDAAHSSPKVMASNQLDRSLIESFIQTYLHAREQGIDAQWLSHLNLGPTLLPIDNPLAFGGNAATNTIVKRLHHDLTAFLGEYPREHLQRVIRVLEVIVEFAHQVADTLPNYLKCQEDGGMGQDASEHDLQEHLFTWLRERFGHQAVYELSAVAGGRPDAGVIFPECTIPIEVKHEFVSMKPTDVRTHYLSQADMYAAATARVAILLILDLRPFQAHHRQSRRTRRATTATTATTATDQLNSGTREQVSFYSVDDSFWVDSLPVDPQGPHARPKAVVIGAIRGNRPLPSSTTTYSHHRITKQSRSNPTPNPTPKR